MRLREEYIEDIKREEIIKSAKDLKLYAVINCNTTNRTLYVEWYIHKDWGMKFVALTKSGAIGMSRIFDCFCRVCRHWKIDCCNEIEQQWRELGGRW